MDCSLVFWSVEAGVNSEFDAHHPPHSRGHTRVYQSVIHSNGILRLGILQVFCRLVCSFNLRRHYAVVIMRGDEVPAKQAVHHDWPKARM